MSEYIIARGLRCPKCGRERDVHEWGEEVECECGARLTHEHDCQYDGEDEHCFDWWEMEPPPAGAEVKRG